MQAPQHSLHQQQPSSNQQDLSTVPGTASLQPSAPPTMTGRPPVLLYLTCDIDTLSPFQVLLRQNIELFEATPDVLQQSAQGRNKPIVLGQVGIRCVNCQGRPASRGSVYFPFKLTAIYQSAQNMSSHLMETCTAIPAEARNRLWQARQNNTTPLSAAAAAAAAQQQQQQPTTVSSTGGGKDVWAARAHFLGVYEDAVHGLRFAPRLNAFVPMVPNPLDRRSLSRDQIGNTDGGEHRPRWLMAPSVIARAGSGTEQSIVEGAEEMAEVTQQAAYQSVPDPLENYPPPG